MTTQGKHRRPYKWGAKEYLSSMDVGETRILDERFTGNGLRCAASRMKELYGCVFVFRTKQKLGLRQVTRIA